MNGASLRFFFEAGPVVQTVLLLLLLASLLSWTVIFYLWFQLRWARREAERFERQFEKQEDLRALYLALLREEQKGVAALFVGCWRQFERLLGHPRELIEHGVERLGRALLARSLTPLERPLGWLAIFGSTSPYVGLFGTVWGVMETFRALGEAERVTFQLIAPGVAEALMATAFGLFVAIPATVAYNRYLSQLELLERRYRAFLDLLIGRLLLEGRQGEP